MSKLMCYVGLNPVGGKKPSDGIAQTEKPQGGGIAIFEVGADGHSMDYKGFVPAPAKAGALNYAKETGVLYAVNEVKTGGRGSAELEKGSSIYAYKVEADGSLTYMNHVPAMGTNPTDVVAIPEKKALYMASHGGFDHAVKVVQLADGTWMCKYEYDDACTAQYALNDDGSIGKVVDVALHVDHGADPNQSPQHGGHAQASGHAHCTCVSPNGKFLLVGDKGSDRVYVYKIGEKLEVAFIYQFGTFSGARHIAFDKNTNRAFVTLEFSSELAAFDFNPETGAMVEIDRISTLGEGFEGRNEPATLRVSPDGKRVFVNNRGEDTIITVDVAPDGKLTRTHAFQLGKSADPGIATRQMEFTPDFKYLFVPERPTYVIRALELQADGSFVDVGTTDIDNPVYVCFAEI